MVIVNYRIIHESGFTSEDFKQYRPVVYSNTIQSLVAILRAMPNLNIAFGNNDREVREVTYWLMMRCVWTFLINFCFINSSAMLKWFSMLYNECMTRNHFRKIYLLLWRNFGRILEFRIVFAEATNINWTILLNSKEYLFELDFHWKHLLTC